VITGRSTPCVRCFGICHVFSFESRTSNSNGHLRTTGRYQVITGRVRHSPVSCVESLSNSEPHRTRGTGRSGAHWTYVQRGLQNALTPDAHHRTHLECPVLSVRHPLLKTGHTRHMNREHPTSGAVRPVLNPNRAKHWQYPGRSGQRPVPPHPASGECFSRDFSKFPTGAIENIHLIFSKASKYEIYIRLCASAQISY